VRVIESAVETELIPGGLPYALLLPDSPGHGLPLLLLLHGGNGDRSFLGTMEPLVRRAWNDGVLPPVAVATPSAGRSLYMDTWDGSARFESAILGPLLEALRTRDTIAAERENTVVCGISMGGLGALRMAFKHPEHFAGVAALEPGIEPVLRFADIEPADRFWRSQALFESIFGAPVDQSYWQANNPANLARDRADVIRKSGLAIYLECGDADSFGLYRGTEFLHRILFDARIPHEYRLVRGADHVGATLAPRFLDAFAFLGRALLPAKPDPALLPLHRMIAAQRRAAGLDEPADRQSTPAGAAF
jgi:S-formylglutathione hydrolase